MRIIDRIFLFICKVFDLVDMETRREKKLEAEKNATCKRCKKKYESFNYKIEYCNDCWDYLMRKANLKFKRKEH